MEPITQEPDAAAEGAARNWIPLASAALLMIAVVIAGLALTGHPKAPPTIIPLNGAADPYAANLVITNLAMSESSNLAGGKVTYIDGHIENKGSRTVSGITLQILFRSYTHEVAQNETIPLKVISMREPYIDTVSVSAAPIKPGTAQDFRLAFDRISSDWAGTLPELRIVHVELK